MSIPITGELVQAAAHGIAILVGLPVLVSVGLQVRRERGLGRAPHRAWPDVCWARDPLGALMVVLVFLIVQQVAFALGGWATATILHSEHIDDRNPSLAYLLLSASTCVAWVVAIAPILWWIVKERRGRPAALGLTLRGARHAVGEGLKLLLAVLPLVIATLYLYEIIRAQFTSAPPVQHPVIRGAEATNNPWLLVGFFVLSCTAIPFFEELFYRGLIQTTLMRFGRPGWAIAATSVLFALAHFGQPESMVPLFFFAMALGMARHRTGTLVAPMVMHGLFNLYMLGLARGAPWLADLLQHLADALRQM